MSNDKRGSSESSPIASETLSTWSTPEPPPAFADGVLAAHRTNIDDQARPLQINKRPSLYWLGAPLCAAAVLLWLFLSPSNPIGGTLHADTRIESAIGNRAVAVLEQGAHLTWSASANSGYQIQQESGDVFYRVNKGDAFVVKTPAGRIRVLGTCFRIAIPNSYRKEESKMATNPLKQNIASGVLGAALSAAVVVTVYEGRVAIQNQEGELVAAPGERVTMRKGQAPALTPSASPVSKKDMALLEQSPDELSQDELVKRDMVAQGELQRLRDEVARLELEKARIIKNGGARDGDKDDHPFFDPPQEELVRMAQECELAFDVPPLKFPAYEIGAESASEMGIAPDKLSAVNAAIKRVSEFALGELRAIYLDVTGDEQGVDNLEPSALEAEIQSKSPKEDTKMAHYLISQERAGLRQPPADLSSRPPAERAMRLLQGLGDEFEKAIASVIGPEQARNMRAHNGGWGSRSRSKMGRGGCLPEAEQ